MSRNVNLAVALLYAISCSVNAQDHFLNMQGLQSAIVDGQRAKGRFQGLELTDSGVGFGLMFAGAMAGAEPPSGYHIVIYTPLEWIKQQASNAAREYKPFAVADLTPSMVENIVRIRVYPSLPRKVTASGTMLASSVDHVVIRDAQRQRVVQPIRTELFSESAQNAMGASVGYHGVDAIFDMKEIEAIRDQNEEFFITIVGTLGERNVKVKRRTLSKLAFLPINASELYLAAAPAADTAARVNTNFEAAFADAMARAKALIPVPPGNSFAQSERTAKPDDLTVAADALLQSLRKVDAAFKVSASQDLLTSALMDAQVRLDEIQHRTDKQRLQKTIESSAFALHGFLEARNNPHATIELARDALDTAVRTFDAFKSNGREPDEVKPAASPRPEPKPATTAPMQKTSYPSVITIH